MKLLHCIRCGDIKAMQYIVRACLCGQSRGAYLDDDYVVVRGEHARVLGIGNGSLTLALSGDSSGEYNNELRAWAFPPGYFKIKYAADDPTTLSYTVLLEYCGAELVGGYCKRPKGHDGQHACS